MRTVRTRDVSARRVVRAGWIVLAALLLALLYRAVPARAQTQGIVITPASATAGTPTNFTGYITTGSGFTSVTWYFSDTNTSTAGSLSGNITTVQHTFATAGNYTITVVAQGSASAYGSQAISVTGYGNGSTGQITITPTSGSPNIPVTFVASSAVQASSATMVWAFGDPNSGVNNSFTGTVSNSTVGTATHTYTSAGTYTVTVNEYGAAIGGSSISLSGSSSITIGSGGSGTTTGAFQVTAGNGSYLGIVSQPIIFYGTAQCNANTQCSGNFNYNWTFSDGTSSGPSTANRSFSKTFNSAGSFTATLAATDLTYNTTNSASQQVCVAPAGGSTSNTCTGTASGSTTTTGSGQVTSNGLTVNPGGPYSGSGGTAITFTATATTSNANSSIVSYVWSFGDGTSGTGQSTTHTYNSSGTFTVALTVTDSTGVAVTATTTAQIAAGQRKINLPQGCSNVASTFPDGTSTGTIVTNVNPSSAVLSIWEYNSAQAKFQGYLPGATQATDLPTINHLDAFFICVNAVATFSEPSG